MDVLRRTLLLLALAAATAAPARADDPGRWRETGLHKLPLVYYQGLTHDPAGNWFFDGIFTGLWRTDRDFARTGENPDAIPPDVKATEDYNHIGDLSWDSAEGGRLLLPVECYYPPAGNTCNTGSIAVADPATLGWRYYVKLDPAEIPKAMWNEVSPDGELIWTSSGDDLLAYRAADVTPANAAPLGPVIRAVRRLPGAVPPVGITGATFHDGRLYTAGQDGPAFQIWSIDLADGSRRLEIERDIVGESEGLDTFDAAGGLLHWLIQPFNTEGPPTYGPNEATLLHFRPAAQPPAGGTAGPAPPGRRLRLKVRPRRVRAGRRVRFRFRVRSASGRRIRGAGVSIAGHRVRTGRRGRARLRLRLRSPGRYRVLASKRGMRSGRASVRAVSPEARGAARAAPRQPPAA
jgi:hypothetical protein